MHASKKFSGKVVVIAGAGRGIGTAISIHFAKQGEDVVVNYIRLEYPKKVVDLPEEEWGCLPQVFVKTSIAKPTKIYSLKKGVKIKDVMKQIALKYLLVKEQPYMTWQMWWSFWLQMGPLI